MPPPTATPRISARAERRAIAALLAVFALLVQALVPSLAAAAQGPGMGAICAGMGTSDHGDTAPTHLPGGGCDHCVCPMAAAPPPAAPEASAPVRYAVGAAPDRARVELAPGRGLAAPPPPSRLTRRPLPPTIRARRPPCARPPGRFR